MKAAWGNDQDNHERIRSYRPAVTGLGRKDMRRSQQEGMLKLTLLWGTRAGLRRAWYHGRE